LQNLWFTGQQRLLDFFFSAKGLMMKISLFWRRLIAGILLSICLHASILLLSAKRFIPPKKLSEIPLVIDLQEAMSGQEVSSKQERQVHQEARNSQNSKMPKLSLSQLKSKWPEYAINENDQRSKHESSDADAFSGNPESDDPKAAWGQGSAEFKRLEDLGLMNRIYEHTEQALYYPGILARHKIEGIVNARLVIAEQGLCDWHETIISSTNPHLRIFILSVLKEVCSQNFKPYLRGRKLTNIDFSFEFELTEHDDSKLIESKNKIIGNVLMFYRNSHQSVTEWHLGPLMGLFPIPAVAVDFGWLQENWDRVMK